jgi:16S rRNA (cytosine967-C5)-methyltransferase
MTPELSNPRDLAVLSLRDRAGNITAHAGRLLGSSGLAGPDAALARELALGVERRKATLQAVLRAFLARPDKRLPGALNEVLLVAVYQLLFLDRVPAFAAVDEAVEQAGRFHHRRQAGMVNGVLRSMLRELSEVQTGPVPAARDVIPVGPRRFRKLARPALADPAVDPAAYVAAAYSMPEFLARRWVARYGLAKAAELGEHADDRAPMILRVNRRAGAPADVLAELQQAGIGARPHGNGWSIVLDDHIDVTALPAFQRGAVQPQDASATGVVLAAEPRPGTKVMDFCAAPGTKTTLLAEMMDDRGSITAVDVSREKLARVEDNCGRMGFGIVKTVLAENVGALEPESFDLVLADAPCTNSGVLARRPEARWRLTPEALSAAAGDQKTLVRLASGFVRRGGRLVYSTCSIEPEECGEVARWLGGADATMRMQREQLSLPRGADDHAQWHDGGYFAIFRKE